MTSWLERRFVAWPSGDAACAGVDRLAPSNDARVLLKRASSPAARAALTTERDLGSAGHRAFRSVVDHGELDGSLAVAFEWIEGASLADAIAGGLSATHAAGEILRALLALHTRGLVHGDLKPDHVLVQSGEVRILDLGLACPLGAPPIGGTHGYLAPEYLAGSEATTRGDLFALGHTLRACVPKATGALSALVSSCVDPDPQRRPASAEAALAMLGLEPRPSDRSATSRRGDRALLARARTTLALHGAVLAIDAAPGSGASSFAVAVATQAPGPCAHARFAIDHDPLIALADALGVDTTWDATRRASAAVVRAASTGVGLVLSDVHRANDESRVRLVVATKALVARARGAIVLVGVDATLAARLGAETDALPPLDANDVGALADDYGVRLAPRDRVALLEATAGRAGHVVRAMGRLALDPRLSALDAASAPETSVASALAPRAAAERALRAGAPRRAIELLAPEPASFDVEHLRARASYAAGELEEARAIFTRLEPQLTGGDAVWLPRTLERLGRPADAEAAALRALPSATSEHGAALATIVATAALALGRAAEVEPLALRYAASAPPSLAARLTSLASDAALRLGDTPRALALGARAIEHAEASGDPSALGQALSRVAGAHGLAGNWSRARDLYVRALAAAEDAGDVTALPPYVMNVAAAEHALTHYAAALARYEEAATLADRLGRAASSAAALVNLASLYGSMGASVEADAVLTRARATAEAGGSKLVRAQCDLIGAEIASARNDHARARDLVRAATQAFGAIDARRQALEAELLTLEIASAAGDPVDPARVDGPLLDAFDAQGLGTRAYSLRATLSLARGALEPALRDADLAVKRAEHAGEREHLLPALRTLAEIHARLGTGGAEGYLARARELRASLAARVPAGLRERFLERHPLPSTTAPQATSRGLGESGRRIVSLLRRALFASDEREVLEAAIDEAIALVRAERAFLLMRGSSGQRPKVAVARNLDRETVRNSRSRFSHSVAERVLATGEPLVTASAVDDPDLAGARSILDLGLRSIVCVPVRDPEGVRGALYLDHRFASGRFDATDLEVVQALADVIGLCLENARLFRASRAREGELERAEAALRQEAERSALEVERLSSLLEGSVAAPDASGIVGQSPALRAAVDLARRVAKSGLPVLVEGESGTGKELFARLVHAESPRASKPLVAVNCASLPETLLESELFGHVRGAFSGAVRDHPGLFRAADGGTLFLDEIGEIPARVQARLLRALQEGEVRPVGGSRTFAVDVRIVSATNRKLEAELGAGRFREDLFFRLAGVRLALPPLRERVGDLPLLVRAVLERVRVRDGVEKQLSRQAMATLHAHAFPGNVRELEQTIRRAAFVSEGDTIEPWHLGLAEGARAERPTRTLDHATVQRALAEHRGNRTRAAASLGVSRVTIHRFLAREPGEIPASRGRPRKKAP